MKRADQLRLKELFVLQCANGRTLARLTRIEMAEDRDLLPEWAFKWGKRDPIIGLHVTLGRAVECPDFPGMKTQHFTIWAKPDDLFEPYERPVRSR